MAGRAVVGRGDLLRALARVVGLAQEADDARCANRLGFDPWKVAPFDKPALRKADGGLSPGSVSPKGREPQPTPERVPLHIQHFVVVKDEHLSPPPPDEDSGGDGASEAESETLEARSTPPRSPPTHVDLVPFSRLLPRLRGELGGEKCAGLDVPEAVGQAARGLPWARAPRRWRGAWPASWLVVLDLSDRVRPYWLDMHRLAARLQSECGAQSCQVRVLRQPGDPTGGWDDWVQDQPQQSAGLSSERQAPEPGQTVLLLSDLGGGANLRDAVTARRWQRWIGALPKAVRVVALSPAGLLCREAEPDRSLHRSTGWRNGTPDDVNAQALQQLLALCAPALRIEPRLLRELRLLLGESGLDGSLEAAVWNHPDLHAGPIACVWNETRREAHAAAFRNLPVRLQRRAGEVLRRHHGGLSDFVGHEETLRWLACAADQVVPEGEVRKARQHFRAFSQGLEHTAAQRVGDVCSYARRLLLRAPGLDESGREVLRLPRLAAWAWQKELRRGESVPVPEGVSYEELVLLADGRLDDDAAAYGLMQVGGVLCLERVNPFMKGFRIATIRAARYLDWCCSDDGRRQVVALNQARIELCRLTWNQLPDLDFRTAGQHLVVQAMERPSWAKSWMRNGTGVFAVIDSPWGSLWHIPISVHQEDEWKFRKEIQSPYISWGRGHDQHGCFAELDFNGVTQRLRYIEPGIFLMGSPDTELGRDSDEGPRHQVTLTEGFWLADTTCTQALWQAVMGKTPSHFQGDSDLPVERVSWDDVQEFLKKLNELLPSDCEAVLPTEAQWEYSCRAGTKTPYWFGESISAEQAHFGQSWNYGRAVPVKDRPANGWGLYQMHGNVWEWCEGSRRRYSAPAMENPPDDRDHNSHALRGGSWDFEAWLARSACRLGSRRVDRGRSFGFRFSLRSIKPSQAKDSSESAAKGVSRPAEPVKGASGRGSRGNKK